MDLTKYTPDQIKAIEDALSPADLKLWNSLFVQTPEEKALELVEKGWRALWSTLFGEEMVSTLAPHHVEAITWHWNSRLAFLKKERPEYLAYFPIWSRGHAKSSLAERIAVVDACLSIVYKQPGFCLYISRNKDKVKDHIGNIENLLYSDKVREYFPTLSQVKRQEQTDQKKQWTASVLHTQASYVFKGGTLDTGLAGSRYDETRVTLMIPDDIDGREDSVLIAADRFKKLTTEIIPMRQGNTLTFFAQNLISRHSVMYQIQNGNSRALTNRKPTQPIPAVLNLVTETKTVGGIVKDVYVSGKSTWDYWDEQRIQDEIDSEGLISFLRECQHEVEQDQEGLVLQNWKDDIHVISYSQFEAVYGTRQIPQHWYKDVANDWARTKTAYHANVAGILAVSAQNSPLPGVSFLFHPMSFPANTAPEDVALRILDKISPTVSVQGRHRTWDEVLKDALDRTNLEKYISNTSVLIEERRKVIASIMPQLVKVVIRAQNYRAFRGSHEQSRTGALDVYSRVFGLPFIGVNPGGDGGIDMLNMLQKIDPDAPHPFHFGKLGRANYYVVVEDDIEDPNPIWRNGRYIYRPVPKSEVLSPVDLHDGQLLRFQFENCRYRNPTMTITGESDQGIILKLNDDFVNIHMMWLYDRSLKAAPLTGDEKIDATLLELAPQLTMESIMADPNRWAPGALAMRDRARKKIREDLTTPSFTSPLQRAEWERGH